MQNKKNLLSSFLPLFLLLILLIGLFLGLFFFSYHYYSKREKFTNSNEEIGTIVLLGDSILKNNSYVLDENKDSIEAILSSQSNKKIVNYASDGSKIINVYQQLDSIPNKWNRSTTTIFLSIGGNDIISNYILNNRTQNIKLDYLFNDYQELIATIQTKMDQCNLRLLDVYYPRDSNFRKYQPIIQEWNDLLMNHYSYNVVPISKHITNHNDFTQIIEVSTSGGEKLARLMLNSS
jgi:lysophospholipase L1-like esterase